MKYFIHIEYNEKTVSTFLNSYIVLELVSIGIVCNDGRSYHAYLDGCDIKKAWSKYYQTTDKHTYKPIELDIFRDTIQTKGKSIDKIRQEIYNFINKDIDLIIKSHINNAGINIQIEPYMQKLFEDYNVEQDNYSFYAKPEIYSFECIYSYVVFCQLFGGLKKLPKGYPSVFIDMKDIYNKTSIKLRDNISYQGYYNIMDGLKDFPKPPNYINFEQSLEYAKYSLKLYNFYDKLNINIKNYKEEYEKYVDGRKLSEKLIQKFLDSGDKSCIIR